MPPSSFSRQQRLTALAGALATALASWLYFGYAGKGVVVSGAGDSAANGYYQWERRQKVYVKAAAGPEGAWRVPNVYDLVSRSPQYRADGEGPVYFMAARDDQKKQRRVWFLSRSGFAVYSTGTAVVEIGDNTPPSSGWVSVMKGDTKEDTINPPPQVDSCGKRVRPDDDIQQRYRGRRGSSSAFALGSGPAEVVKYPVTVLFVLVNLLIAYHLWAKRVSPDAVAISYALFWEEREYWRLVTASFSHFEPLHLLFNAMSTWNTRETERLLGSFRHLYLSLDLVVTTIMLVMVIKHFLIKWGMENHRQGKAVGFSCVIFAYMTYLAVAMREFCPMGQSFSTLCFKTWSIPMPGGLPPLPVNLGPFGSLALAQIIMPRAAFLGHLAGIFMGYLMSWGMLGRLSTPLLAGASVVLMMQHSKCWARNMPDFSLLLQGWAGGDVGRVSRARRLNTVFAAHV